MSVELLEQLAAARFDELLAAAASGAPLLLRARRADTPDRVTHRAAVGPHGFLVEPVAGGRDPVGALLAAGRAAGAGADDLGELVDAPSLRYVLFVADGTGADAGAWLTLAGAFASLRTRREAGPALLVTVAGPGAPKGCRYYDDGGLVGPVESAMLARVRRSEAGLVTQAADAAAIETARGDAALLDRLLDLPEAERFDPSGWAARSKPAGDDPEHLPWRGEEVACPIWLARRDPARLRRRVWRGHLGVLLPWLEEVRAAFLARNAPRLPAGPRDPLTGEPIDPAAYEWGHIAAALRRTARAPAGSADAMRRVRNALAHGEPARWDECRGIEGDARRLLDWR